jgi:hypothetical protein
MIGDMRPVLTPDRAVQGLSITRTHINIDSDPFHTGSTSWPHRGRDQSLRRQMREYRTDAGGDGLRRLRLGVAQTDDAKDHGLVAEAVEGREIEIGWAASIEICSTLVAVSSGRNE